MPGGGAGAIAEGIRGHACGVWGPRELRELQEGSGEPLRAQQGTPRAGQPAHFIGSKGLQRERIFKDEVHQHADLVELRSKNL